MTRRAPQPALGKRLRKAGNTKRGYSVWLDFDGNPAPFDATDETAVWKKVKRKQRDLDNKILLLTFEDDTELRMPDYGALVTCRFAAEDSETEEEDS
jgi:hypothetical protein